MDHRRRAARTTCTGGMRTPSVLMGGSAADGYEANKDVASRPVSAACNENFEERGKA